jgi:hypothetical protein
MNFSEMQREVQGLLMDVSPNILLTIPDLINEAVAQIAEDVRFPELKQISSVVTDTSKYYVNMPAGFSSRLTYAGNSDGEYSVLDTIEDLIRLYPTLVETGDIEYVVCEGNVFYYHPIPTTAVTVICIGYYAPSVLVNDSDTPSFIPDYLHREAIVNQAVANAYAIIEDGVEVEKANTRVFMQLAMGGLNKVRAYVSRRRPVVGTSIWSD